jgi:hypothetical protein
MNKFISANEIGDCVKVGANISVEGCNCLVFEPSSTGNAIINCPPTTMHFMLGDMGQCMIQGGEFYFKNKPLREFLIPRGPYFYTIAEDGFHAFYKIHTPKKNGGIVFTSNLVMLLAEEKSNIGFKACLITKKEYTMALKNQNIKRLTKEQYLLQSLYLP